MQKTRIALIGFGSVNKDVFRALSEPDPELGESLYDMKVFLRSRLMRRDPLPDGLTSVDSVQRLLDWRPDLIIEAASPQAVRDYVPLCLMAGRHVMIASVSAFADPFLYEQIFRSAERGEGHISIPSGAVAGLDYLQALKGVDDVSVTYQSRKAVCAWSDELRAQGLDPSSITEPFMLFQGTAQQALERYSKRLNVAATLALAGVGMQRTLVQVVIDPKVSGNEHHLKVSSPLGHMLFKLSNEPAPGGSGTSWVVAHSIVAAVKRRFNSRMAVV
ncbi:MAG: DUF108 domain-containing protein [Alcaligenaceae bacterium]|nr:DUF108 domain-containing protein [Alcaligenaceae bacterium]